MKISHGEWAKLLHLAVPCNASHITFGGHCMNCGYRPERVPLYPLKETDHVSHTSSQNPR